MAETTDVVVAGGGVIGLAAAWETAGRGLSVRVVDPAPGHGAAWVAAGMLAPVTESTFGEEALAGLFVAAADRWPGFASRLQDATGSDTGFRTCGSVAVALDASDRAAIDQLLDHQLRLGLEASRLSASECRALVPALSPAVRGGALMPGDHQVDNRALVLALIEGCAGAGVKLTSDRVVSVSLDRDGAAAGVVTESGELFQAGTVVLAAGVGTPQIGGLPEGVVPPVRPVKGHTLRLRAEAGREAFPHTVRGLVHGRHCYLVSRADGTVVIGATSEERGYDTRVQAGAVHSLLDDARLLLPAVDEWELLECIAGLRPGSPDNAPFVGPTSVARLVVATGHYRNGFLLAPITAEAIAEHLTGGEIPAPLAAFRADRHVEAARSERPS
ncbi:MAG: glycine oxidase ThiO [Actinomycetota bacterium]|nr:glycine oxidase ThiO [Actinomycetota bacterium]